MKQIGKYQGDYLVQKILSRYIDRQKCCHVYMYYKCLWSQKQKRKTVNSLGFTKGINHNRREPEERLFIDPITLSFKLSSSTPGSTAPFGNRPFSESIIPRITRFTRFLFTAFPCFFDTTGEYL